MAIKHGYNWAEWAVLIGLWAHWVGITRMESENVFSGPFHGWCSSLSKLKGIGSDQLNSRSIELNYESWNVWLVLLTQHRVSWALVKQCRSEQLDADRKRKVGEGVRRAGVRTDAEVALVLRTVPQSITEITQEFMYHYVSMTYYLKVDALLGGTTTDREDSCSLPSSKVFWNYPTSK